MGLAHPLQAMAVCTALHLLKATNEAGGQNLALVAMHSETRMCWDFLTWADSNPLLLSQNMGSRMKFAIFIVPYFIDKRCIFSEVTENLAKNVK